MSSKKPDLKIVENKEQSDGRRQRSQRSRQKILEAMWELMLEGDMDPSAADIAEQAGVGLRSVFRHFEDMETIHRELVLLAEAKVTPHMMQPFRSRDWKGQLIELVSRTVDLWDPLLVPHTAVETRRFKSDILMDDYKRSRMKELSAIKAVLPVDIPNHETVLLSLDAILCFSNIRRMREERNLSVAKTKAVMTHLVDAIIKDIP